MPRKASTTVKAAAQAADTTVKKATAAVKKQPDEVYLQFGAKEADINAIVAEAKAAFKAANGRKAVKSCQIYLKPEESAAYYVINSEFTGKIEL